MYSSAGIPRVKQIRREETPKLPELIHFHSRNRTINVPQQISTKCHDFGVLLLEDDSGSKVDAITHEHRDNPYKINCTVIKQWLRGEGRKPVNWNTLVAVLRDSENYTLAVEIEEVLCL